MNPHTLSRLLLAFADMNPGQRSAILRALGQSAVIPPTPMESEEAEDLCRKIKKDSKK